MISPPAPPVDVPSAADATSIARALLNRLGVLAGQDWSTAVNDSGGVAVSCAVGMPCPTVPSEVSARTVTFSLTLDGTRVDGVDWSVTIGEHHRIESVNGEWATPVAISSYPLRSTAAVFADLQHGIATYPGPQPMIAMSGAPAVEAPTIATSPTPRPSRPSPFMSPVSRLGLARWDAYDNGQTVVDLVPTYRFHAHVESSSTNDIEVLALDLGAVTFTNPTRHPNRSHPDPAHHHKPRLCRDAAVEPTTRRMTCLSEPAFWGTSARRSVRALVWKSVRAFRRASVSNHEPRLDTAQLATRRKPLFGGVPDRGRQAALSAASARRLG